MKPNKIETAYETGRRVGKAEGHSSPSPETIKMVGDLNIKLERYCTKMEDLIKKVDEGFELNSKQHGEIVALIKESLEKKADKWVETVIRWFLFLVGTGVLGVVGTLVYQAIIHFSL